MIAIILLISLSGKHTFDAFNIIVVTLIVTLSATAATLWVQHALMEPIRVCRDALTDYVEKQQLPNIPKSFPDEIGVLMRGLTMAIHTFDNHIQEKKAITNLLAHDLRAPLNNIIQITELIDGNQDEESLKEYVHYIRQAAAHQRNILGNVLELMRLEIRHSQTSEQTNVKEVINRCVEHLSMNITAKDLKVNVNVMANHKINISKQAVELVINNLLTNAIKFSQPGQPVYIEGARHKDHFQLSVRDEGEGFNTEDTSRLFDVFTRLSREGTFGEVSNGIGLHLCKKIIESNGGRITAKSEGKGSGATFTLVIPY
ncbi:sensor histidine kinase [Hufsiella ginkgonis]|uniref:histidine kinase n=1 Tax=Hufsiella ginkgonis TaxID=2695274 RepID=A0A7K1XXB7_9SPHI|nr:HAMP domain-containing sensor histidine kinase [Hufsiella ginkgonis]MXV15369.1 hypothetical protein [Hufsiella ginkgonis]